LPDRPKGAVPPIPLKSMDLPKAKPTQPASATAIPGVALSAEHNIGSPWDASTKTKE